MAKWWKHLSADDETLNFEKCDRQGPKLGEEIDIMKKLETEWWEGQGKTREIRRV